MKFLKDIEISMRKCFLDKLLYCRLLKRVINGKNIIKVDTLFLIKNIKENLEEVNIEKVKKEFKNFLKLYNEKIKRIKKVI